MLLVSFRRPPEQHLILLGGIHLPSPLEGSPISCLLPAALDQRALPVQHVNWPAIGIGSAPRATVAIMIAPKAKATVLSERM